MYKSPIEIIHEIQSGVKMQIENGILEDVRHYGINVDKDELIRALQYDRQQYEKGYDDGKAEALQWIPCSERLPEKPVQVLVYAMNTHFSIAKYKEIRKGVNEYVYTWVTDNAFDVPHEVKNVLAWMPLPEPYKGRT